ncbi:hypothetical protein [uncultured Methanoregula sp.]|uniref:hypothetical protein n=1 Tax=uncultured Methanoregula sp. TaxID=1005933 RepID=UPI002AAA7173|nr:hypothetical protein [uncultured Methanoregula sp.]
MRSLFCIVLVLLIGILASGCTQQTASSPAITPVTPTTAAAITAPAVPATGSSLAELSNTRSGTLLSLDPGPVIVSFNAENAQPMTFWFSQGQDYAEGSDLVMTGPYTGSLAVAAPKKGEYQLNISGSGSWTARVARAEMTTPLKAPVNLSGSGTSVTPCFALEKGEYFFNRNETGLASPLYELRYANGSYLMDVNNTFVQPGFGMGSPHPFGFIEIPENGTYFLSVIAKSNPHPWNVSISVVPRLPPMGPGPAIPGKV